MNIKTVTTNVGVNEICFAQDGRRYIGGSYYWLKNIGTSDVHVSSDSGIEVDGDNTALLAAGEMIMLVSGNRTIYILGAGKVEIHEGSKSICPFKSAASPSGVGGGTGADGKSAYEVAVANGFEGSVAEWLDSLQGEPGPQGESAVSAITPRGDYNAAAAPTYTVGDYITHTDGNTYVCKVDNPTNTAPTDGTMADPFWQLIALRGAQGPAGAAGKDATINGSNALIIATGVGLNGAQADGVYTMSLDGSAICNPNLLDNPNFSINQRGQSIYDGTVAGIYKYTVDRWCFWKYNCDTYGTITVNTDGSLSVDGADGSNDCILTQIMENGDKFIGKTVTLSVEITELTGSLLIGLHTHSEYISASKPGIYNLTFTWPEISAYKIFVNNANSSHYTIKWMKLELGSVATAFVPPNPATELAKCQRFALALEPYVRYAANTIFPGGIDFFIPTPQTMRILPTLDLDNFVVRNANHSIVEGFTFAMFIKGSNGFVLRSTKDAHGLTWACLDIKDKTKPAIASADL